MNFMYENMYRCPMMNCMQDTGYSSMGSGMMPTCKMMETPMTTKQECDNYGIRIKLVKLKEVLD